MKVRNTIAALVAGIAGSSIICTMALVNKKPHSVVTITQLNFEGSAMFNGILQTGVFNRSAGVENTCPTFYLYPTSTLLHYTGGYWWITTGNGYGGATGLRSQSAGTNGLVATYSAPQGSQGYSGGGVMKVLAATTNKPIRVAK